MCRCSRVLLLILLNFMYEGLHDKVASLSSLPPALETSTASKNTSSASTSMLQDAMQAEVCSKGSNDVKRKREGEEYQMACAADNLDYCPSHWGEFVDFELLDRLGLEKESDFSLLETDERSCVALNGTDCEQRQLLEVQGLLSREWKPTARCTKSFRVVDTIEYARLVLKAFLYNDCKQVTFDTEGVQLSRTGRLTVISISLCKPCSIAFLFDLVSIGTDIFDCKNSLMKCLIESKAVEKVTYDCRNDSNALFHQFGVKLCNCLDLQVYQLGINIEGGWYESQVLQGIDYLKGLKFRSGKYLTIQENRDMWKEPAPHHRDPEIWGKRPLADTDWQYAANDVHCINRILSGMKHIKLSGDVQHRIKIGSQRYTEFFRDSEVDYQANLEYFRDELCKIVPI